MTSPQLQERTLVIKLNPFSGFFSSFNCVVNHLAHSLGKHGVTAVRVDWRVNESVRNFPYSGVRGGNVWEEFFEPLRFDRFPETCITRQLCADGRMTHILPYLYMYKFGARRRQMYHDVYARHVVLKPHIEAKVQALWASLLQGHFCVGVHYRNNPHALESPEPTPPPSEFIRQVRELAGKRVDVRVFLASDVEEAVHLFRAAFGDRLVCQGGVTRARRIGDPRVHHDCKAPSARLGEEVLIDCLLLARCDVLVHTTSNVATAASYINPRLVMVYCERSAVRGFCMYGLKRVVLAVLRVLSDLKYLAMEGSLRRRHVSAGGT